MNRELSRWFCLHGRHSLPWRLTRDPYAVLVSEVMLQQTQVDRVLPYYHWWLERWPTVEVLAASSPAEVIREWAGLGYNRRALNLHRAAQTVVERHAGTFPRHLNTLRTLPGVGPYTAAAIASFAFEQRVPLADTNIARVLARTQLGLASNRGISASTLNAAAHRLLPARNARDHNLALMDLGALVCTSRGPSCDTCPIRRHCAWHASGRPEPNATATPSPRFETTARYARGRIIHALRIHPSLDEPSLAALLPAHHHPNLSTYLSALSRDGLVTLTPTGWSLPKS
ncbi:MAG TPA: A/G-specific adenine glycosylase [Tepidiformaceae bacterium]|nr:A/G-specific adenine glycosylase [Tepidiformaceae bacterium]